MAPASLPNAQSVSPFLRPSHDCHGNRCRVRGPNGNTEPLLPRKCSGTSEPRCTTRCRHQPADQQRGLPEAAVLRHQANISKVIPCAAAPSILQLPAVHAQSSHLRSQPVLLRHRSRLQHESASPSGLLLRILQPTGAQRGGSFRVRTAIRTGVTSGAGQMWSQPQAHSVSITVRLSGCQSGYKTAFRICQRQTQRAAQTCGGLHPGACS